MTQNFEGRAGFLPDQSGEDLALLRCRGEDEEFLETGKCVGRNDVGVQRGQINSFQFLMHLNLYFSCKELVW